MPVYPLSAREPDRERNDVRDRRAGTGVPAADGFDLMAVECIEGVDDAREQRFRGVPVVARDFDELPVGEQRCLHA